MERRLDIDRLFETICSGVKVEAERTRNLCSASPLHRLSGLSGLPARSEAHLTHAIARSLDNEGWKTVLDEPYTIEHQGGVKRFDLRIVLDESEQAFAAQFLTLEIKKYLLIDNAMGGMLRDCKKLKMVLKDEHAILNLPLGFLSIGFDDEERSSREQHRLASFERRGGIADWHHLARDIKIAGEDKPMRVCLVDMWYTTST